MTNFKVTRINLRRKQRGAEYIDISIFENDEYVGWEWIRESDIAEIKKDHGEECFLNRYLNEKIPTSRMKIYYDVPMFMKSSIFTVDRGNEHIELFKKSNTYLDMMDFFVDGADTKMDKDSTGHYIEFSLLPHLEKMLLEKDDSKLKQSSKKERYNDR